LINDSKAILIRLSSFYHHGIATFSDIQLPLCQSQVWNKEEGCWWGADTATVKIDEEKGIKNTEIWKVKGRAMDTNMGESPGYQSQSM